MNLPFFTSFPVRAIIHEQRGEFGSRYRITKWRMVQRRDKTWVGQLQDTKETTQMFDYSDFGITGKGKTIIELVSPQKGQYFPTKLKISHNPEIIAEDKGATSWLLFELRRTEELYKKKQGFLEKYASYVMLAAVVGLVGIFLFFFMEKMVEVTNIVAGAASTLAQKSVLQPIPK